ncbi:MAG TPA: LysM peptidoglycan-binding domain-containing protein [Desulfobacteraceae bacterium]|nr:LysM peptidoglycan-binding domain-containing protein [Desulfobacteraceae bacterium]
MSQKINIVVFILLFAIIPVSVPCTGASETASFPSLASAVRIMEELFFCGERVPLENPEIRERLERELLISLWQRHQALLWIKRSSRYFPVIERILKEEGLPEDLKYVPVAESALRPHAGSHKGAVGYWQFMAHTARKYGLTVSAGIDERRNIFASTRAAARHFKDLYEMFGSWTLAAAAYNMGEGGLTAEILEQETEDFYRLYLYLETQAYIFRILSAKLIISSPEKYGFFLKETDYYRPVESRRVSVICERETPVRVVARAAGTHFKVIKDLNPEIRGHNLAKGSYMLRVPPEGAEGFGERFKREMIAFVEDDRRRIYVVQIGDNLSAIARRFDVPLAALVIWNGIDPSRPIHPGDRLVIYPGRGLNPEVDEGSEQREAGK